MKTVTIDINQCDYTLICEKSANSIFFFKKCIITHEDIEYPFGGVSIQFIPDRLTRRPLVAMLKDLVQTILEDDVNKEQIAEIVYRFLFHLG